MRRRQPSFLPAFPVLILPSPVRLALLLLGGLFLAGGRVLAAEPLTVLVSQKPLALLVSELAGDSVELAQLIPDGVSPHEFSLAWSGRRQLNDADLIVWGGAGLEPQLAGVIATLPAERVFDASEAVSHWATASDCHDHHEHEHRHGHDHRGEAGDGREHCRDPHFWFDPRNMLRVAEALLARLEALSSAEVGHLTESWHSLSERIDTVDRQAEEALSPLRDRYYVVEHDAYNHFTQRYGLAQPGFLRVGHGTPLGPRSLARLTARDDIACVFTEPEYPAELAHRLAGRTGARLVELDPLGSQVSLERGYTGFMAQFVDTVARCLASGPTT